MSPSILVTGGTGTLGAQVIPLLREAGQEVRVLSRHAHAPGDGVEYVVVDLKSGEGLDAALRGVRTVLHLAGGPRDDDATTRNLVEAAVRAGGVEHFVFISVIGAGAVPIGYFVRKGLAERIVIESAIPYSILRAAQFHELAFMTVRALAKTPVLLAAGAVRWQPVSSREVAVRLAELTLGAPAGRVPDLAGPRVYTFEELQRGYLAAAGKRRMRLPIRLPGKVGKAYRTGANLAFEQAGRESWEDFLTERMSHSQGSVRR